LKKTTPAKIKSALRREWLRSPERAEALKRDKYTCQGCLKKQSKRKGAEQKVEVHHFDPIEWENVVAYLQRHLFVSADKLVVLCPDCHKRKHDGIPF
jgi:predicted HNH restriction endonuclease